ncbi:hypothetical protein [Rhizosaccharibacter radicis]|uniref:YbjN domain-containing protein n=1 Tax=Rhizosaccharibacter radicis TaxID=2782605 RepID=A0ABT1W0S3_9PROT|nr:hypothetical protein [Acetobacteraceae bacterium KSS12]
MVSVTERAPVPAPFAAIDLSRWVLTLTDEDYRQCAPGEHRACGASVASDGSRTLICVEVVGGQLMVQRYRPVVMSATHCRLVSISDVFNAPNWITVEVIWDISVVSASDGNAVFTNSIVSKATPTFLATLDRVGVSFSDAARTRAAAAADHNRRETPLFAAQIARLAGDRRPQA